MLDNKARFTGNLIFSGARWHIGRAFMPPAKGCPCSAPWATAGIVPKSPSTSWNQEKCGHCNGLRTMITERISNSCLKRWHLNHHSPLLTIQDREKKPVLSPKTGHLPRHRQSGKQISAPKSKGLNGRFTGPYFFP